MISSASYESFYLYLPDHLSYLSSVHCPYSTMDHSITHAPLHFPYHHTSLPPDLTLSQIYPPSCNPPTPPPTGTEVENIIDQLYAGELVDYLRCIDVDYHSERVDKFLDFALAIVPFGSDQALHSLGECIETYLRPEILEGDNKYFAESVGRKVDAIKGLKFGKLPLVMSVQLKRFVYDFSGYNVVQKKVNDMVSFPMLLDMNKYVARRQRAPSIGASSGGT